MRKNIIVHGLIAGIIVAGLMIPSVNYMSHCEGNVNYSISMLMGYAAMLLAFSLVFVGIRNYRDKYNGGFISFGKAFKTGILITLIASTMYVIAWLIDYYFFIPDFMDKYTAHALAELKSSGASQLKIEEETKSMAQMAEWYKNPFFVILMTYVEILPVGLIVTVISALILKRKRVDYGLFKDDSTIKMNAPTL